MFVNISSKDPYQIKLGRSTKFSEWSIGFVTFGSPDPRGVYSYSPPPPKGREELKKEQEKRIKSEARKKNILKEENTQYHYINSESGEEILKDISFPLFLNSDIITFLSLSREEKNNYFPKKFPTFPMVKRKQIF